MEHEGFARAISFADTRVRVLRAIVGTDKVASIEMVGIAWCKAIRDVTTRTQRRGYSMSRKFVLLWAFCAVLVHSANATAQQFNCIGLWGRYEDPKSQMAKDLGQYCSEFVTITTPTAKTVVRVRDCKCLNTPSSTCRNDFQTTTSYVVVKSFTDKLIAQSNKDQLEVSLRCAKDHKLMTYWYKIGETETARDSLYETFGRE